MQDHLLELALLDDATFAEHDHMITKETGLTHVVGNGDGSLVQSSKDLQQVFLQIVPNQRIESTHRFIQEKYGRIEHQGSHDPDTLPLATGDLTWVTVQGGAGQSGQIG